MQLRIRDAFAALIIGGFAASAATAVVVSYDFESGVPAGTSVHGSAQVTPTGGVGNSGVLRVTQALNSQQGGFFVGSLSPDPVTQFVASLDVRIGGGTARPADGLSFNFGSGIGPGTTGEEGTGALTISLDTWDNNGADTAPAMEIKVNGAAVAFQSFAGIREGGRAPAGPILQDGGNNDVFLGTGNEFAQLVVRLNSNNTMTVDYKGIRVFENVSVAGYVPQAGNFLIGARTGGANDNHFVDNLRIAINASAVPEPATASLALLGLGGLMFRRRRTA